MGLANPIREGLRNAGLLPDALPDHSAFNSRGEGVAVTVTRRTADLEAPDVDFLRDGGWTAVSIRGDGGGGGLTSHRGVLQKDEYVDSHALRVLIEPELGFSFAQVRSVYRQGPLSTEQSALRARIDGRLLELSAAGGEMHVLAGAFGWKFTAGGNGPRCCTMERALRRARAAA